MSDFSDFLALNPFTNERYVLHADYPELFDDKPGRIIEYSPQLDSVAYLQGGVSGPFYYTLWDIQDKTALAQLEPVGDMHAFPRWSSDGSQFVGIFNLVQHGHTPLVRFVDPFHQVSGPSKNDDQDADDTQGKKTQQLQF